MTKLLLIALGLGLAGLDASAALAAIGALGAGARDRHVLAFGTVTILGTLAFGTTLSLVLGPRISGIDWGMFLPHDPTEDRIADAIGMVVGLGLLAWGVVRVRRPAARPPKPHPPRGIGLLSLAGVGVLFALAAIVDPAFVSLVVIAGRDEPFGSVVAAQSTWAFVSHAPLVLVLVAAVAGQHERVETWFISFWARMSPTINRVVTGALFLVGTLLVLDSAWSFATGKLLLPG